MDKSTMVESKSSKRVVIKMKPRQCVECVCVCSKITKERDIGHTFVEILFRVENREVIP